ncbi:glycosyltransferase [Pseudomonas donghuensis]|uniref:glycosyltransferase n=1 Tax=Pseudomonas donghuensis TaxID=1163398 RepID=UPI0021603B58|nr:glycosyltransferase [Pseudomonas donghuensis]UVL22297.1 glycosyltransferase [Pseudomonas donghuensis]
MAQALNTLVSFATSWGTRFGGINSFNYDLLGAFAILCCRQVETVCVVLWANDEDFVDAASKQVRLISLGLEGQKHFSPELKSSVRNALDAEKVSLGTDTVWLGHDRITGDIAVAAAHAWKGRSALIHHMSYSHYEAFAENSVDARGKEDQQRALFQSADVVMAVGPLLRDALLDLREDGAVAMLVPGLPEIDAKGAAPRNFKAILSGRLSEDARKIKQAHLGVAAFSQAIRVADTTPHLDNVFLAKRQPSLLLRGVDFEKSESEQIGEAELELRCFAEQHADRAYNLKALPFTTDRKALFTDIRNASVAMMPSWHEGFGLVAWEAIAAGVPVVISDKSGAYQMLEEWQEGLYKGHVTSIDVRGSNIDPFYKEQDIQQLVGALNVVGNDSSKRRQAASLREALAAEFTWTACARACANALGWDISESATTSVPSVSTAAQTPLEFDWLSCPGRSSAAMGHSDSQLLRAEAAVVPFDKDREPFLNLQLDWVKAPTHSLAIRLLTGAGGVGKTRLGLELCKRLRESGWLSGILSSEFTASSMARVAEQLKAAKQPSLIVIDYAETRQDALLALIKVLHNGRLEQPIRILLLARDGGEWWRRLPEHDSECEGVLSGSQASGPYQLPMLHESVASRQRAYQEASLAFAQHLNIGAVDLQPNLEAEHFDRPLFIQMAALMTLRGESAKSAEGLPRAVLNHESEYWQKTLAAQGLADVQSLRQATMLMTLSTLVSGIPTARVLDDILDLKAEERANLKRLYDVLTPLYPDRQGLQALRPDLLGEALVAKVLLEHGGSVFERVLAEGSGSQVRSALTVVARMLRYREDLAPTVFEVMDRQFSATMDGWIAVCLETRSPLPGILEGIFSQMSPKRKIQVAGALKDKLQVEMIALLGLRQQVGEVLVGHFSDKNDKAGRKGDVARSSALKWHSKTLRYIGQSVLAKDTMEQALSVSRSIAQRDPRHTPTLMDLLCDISQHRAEFGMSDSAMSAIEEALVLVRKHRTIMVQQRAKVLGLYALRLDECGQGDKAIDYAKQSLELHRSASQANSSQYHKNMGIAYNRYSNLLGNNGCDEDALQTAKCSLESYRQLIECRGYPDDPDWVIALNNYANRLSQQGDMEEAISYIEEGHSIASRLAEAKPERFTIDLADAGYSYSLILGEHGDIAKALEVGDVALKGYQGLNEAHLLYRHGIDREKCRLLVAMWRWLDSGQDLYAEARKPLEMETHPEAQGIAFQRLWLCAIAVPDQAHLQSAFEHWESLNRADQHAWKTGYFLISALAEHFLGADDAPSEWRTEFLTYLQKRNGHLPFWMSETLKRLGCSFPTP